MNAPIRHTDSIGELCVALAHRWEPERLFVIFTAYFDESDTHGPNPTVILSAFLGHAYQWRQFEKKLARLQQRDRFSIFHAKDFKGKTGEFEGWSDEKCSRLITDLTGLVRHNLTEGVTIALERERYLSEYRAPPIPKKMSLDSQYGVCFRACLSHLLSLMEERHWRDRLHIVIENGHQNVGDCLRIFDDTKRRLKRYGVDVLGDISIKWKTECAPLMVADLLANTHSMINAERKGTSAQDYSGVMAQVPRGQARLTFLGLNPGALTRLKEYFERDRQLQIEEWRKQRDARKASSSMKERSS
jgi:hypothetical protein